MYKVERIPGDKDRFDSREFEISLFEDGVVIDKGSSYLFEYESMAFNKEQAMQLAKLIRETYGE